MTPGNPRGWFNDGSLDIRTDDGRAKFAGALQKYAAESIAILKTANAQGAIVWDIEGQEYPHKTTYIGAPQMIEALAPEMSDAVDAFFTSFRTAGLRVGVTVRPQRLTAVGGRMEQVTVPNEAEVLEQRLLMLTPLGSDAVLYRFECRTALGTGMDEISEYSSSTIETSCWFLNILIRCTGCSVPHCTAQPTGVWPFAGCILPRQSLLILRTLRIRPDSRQQLRPVTSCCFEHGLPARSLLLSPDTGSYRGGAEHQYEAASIGTSVLWPKTGS